METECDAEDASTIATVPLLAPHAGRPATARSCDSRTCGPVPMGLIKGVVIAAVGSARGIRRVKRIVPSHAKLPIRGAVGSNGSAPCPSGVRVCVCVGLHPVRAEF